MNIRIIYRLLLLLFLVPCMYVSGIAQSHAADTSSCSEKRFTKPRGKAFRIYLNTLADQEGLTRYATPEDITYALREKEALVPVTTNTYVSVDGKHMPWWRAAYLQRVDALMQDIGRAYRAASFTGSVHVNSGVRDRETQRKLRRINSTAAPADGPEASSHLTGAAVDIARKPMSRRGRKAVEQWLTVLERCGYVVFARERYQNVFHVYVTDKYTVGTLQQLLKEQAK